MTVNERLRNDTIKHAHYLEQYKTSEVNDILKMLNKTDAELRKKLLSYKKFDTFSKKRVKIMQKNVSDMINESRDLLRRRMDGVAKEFGKVESEWTAKSLNHAVPKEVSISIYQPSPIQILSAVRAGSYVNTTMTKMVSSWSERKKTLFNGAIQQGWIQGKPIEDIVKNLFGTRKLKYTDGLISGSRRELRTNIRTAINHVSSVSRNLTYEKNMRLVKGVQWVSTLDGATSLICMNLDGKVDYYDGKRELNGQRPPAHYNCRSTTVPVIRSLREMGLKGKDFSAGTRASMNGQVSAKETYATWFKKQDPAFQKKVLGKGKYDLYAKGKYKLSSFVTDNNKVMTLEQLKMAEIKKPIPIKKVISKPALSKKYKIVPFKESKTIEQAEKWAKENFGIKRVSYKDMEVSTANIMNRSICENFNRFPELRGTIDDVGTIQSIQDTFVKKYIKQAPKSFSEGKKIKKAMDLFGAIPEGTFGQSIKFVTYDNKKMVNGIGLNSHWTKKVNSFMVSINRSADAGFHPHKCYGIKSIVDHEMGHEIDKLLGNLSSTVKFEKMVSRYDIGKGLCKYPLTVKSKQIRFAEILAEGWTEYLNSPTPRRISKKIGEMITEEYKMKFGGK